MRGPKTNDRRFPLPRTPAALAATAQVLSHSTAHEVIELAECLARIAQPKIVGPASQVAVQPFYQLRQRRMTLLRIDELPQRLPFPVHRLARGFQVPVGLGSPYWSRSYRKV